MIRPSLVRLVVVPFVTLVCVVSLAACGSGGTPSSQGTRTTSKPGPADSAICQMVSQATVAYKAKDYANLALRSRTDLITSELLAIPANTDDRLKGWDQCWRPPPLL